MRQNGLMRRLRHFVAWVESVAVMSRASKCSTPLKARLLTSGASRSLSRALWAESPEDRLAASNSARVMLGACMTDEHEAKPRPRERQRLLEGCLGLDWGLGAGG